MVRSALSAAVAVAIACLAIARPHALEQDGAAAVAGAVLWGRPMPPADAIGSLPRDVQERAATYRQRERSFRSAMTPPRGATDLEREVFEKRIVIERVLFCLFTRRDIERVAASYAVDADIATRWEGDAEGPRREAAFVDDLLRDNARPWLAPYLNLIAGHRKLCASQLSSDSGVVRREQMDAARRQIGRARDGGHPLIRAAAEYLLASGECGAR